MAGEMSPAPKIIATGGLAPLMDEVCETIEEIDLSLTLEGLRIIAELS
jgi:type III pantothenate kinase